MSFPVTAWLLLFSALLPVFASNSVVHQNQLQAYWATKAGAVPAAAHSLELDLSSWLFTGCLN